VSIDCASGLGALCASLQMRPVVEADRVVGVRVQTVLQGSSSSSPELKDDQIEEHWSVLLIEDDMRDAQSVTQFLRRCGACGDVAHCSGLASALALLAAQTFDVVIAELPAAQSGGLATVDRLRAAAPDAALIAISDETDEVLGAQLQKLGAQRHLLKAQLDRETLGRALRQAVAFKRGERR
jgi:two-component system, cell cycle sensor histidine kinase and response regulator CckA